MSEEHPARVDVRKTKLTSVAGAMGTRSPHAAAEFALMGVLREGPRHGYALAAAFAPDGLLGEVLRLGTSQMYAYLHKLERQGWLQATEEGVERSERTRRVFRLTAAGAHAFDAWLHAPVAATREVRLDFLVKLTFALAQDPAAARDLLERQREASAVWLTRLAARLERAEAAPPPEPTGTTATDATATDATHAMRIFVLRHRVRQSQATIAWLDEALAELAP